MKISGLPYRARASSRARPQWIAPCTGSRQRYTDGVINSKWHSSYPTNAHARRGKEVGLSAEKVEAMLSGLPTSFVDEREQIVYEITAVRLTDGSRL
jgi:hypothetical protein